MHMISHLPLRGRAQLQKVVMFGSPFHGTPQKSRVASFKSIAIASF